MRMSAGSIASFTGTLVEAQQKPGNKYMQLVFHTAEGIRLSVSRNSAMVRSLTVGEKYHVKGKVYALGNKLYINEPKATLVQAARASRKKRVVLGIMAIIVIGTGAGAFAESKNIALGGVAETQTNIVQNQPETTAAPEKAATVPAVPAQPATTPVPNPAPARSSAARKTQTAPAVNQPTQQPSTVAETPSGTASVAVDPAPQPDPPLDTSGQTPAADNPDAASSPGTGDQNSESATGTELAP